MTTAAQEPRAVAIALTELRVSPMRAQAERRKSFDKTALAELADSIRSVGVLSPILARKVNGHFEIVFGERRYLAAKEAGLKTMVVNVRELSDEQVLEAQLVENLQREGLHELAEAEGYEQLHKLGHSAEEIAEKVGKSKAYVYARMKLLVLGKEGRKAFYDDKISASIALLLARIPVPELQKEALEEVLDRGQWDGPMSYREAQEMIQGQYTTRLADAGFPTADAELIPKAGPCTTCPKRTGNQPELFDDIKSADVCTDPVCFKAKREAQFARLQAEGAAVVTGKEAKKLSSYGSGYHKLEETCYEDPKRRTYAQLLGKSYEPTLVQDEEDGRIIKLAPAADVKQALKDAGVKARPAPSNPQSAQEKKAKAENKFRRALFDRVREKYPKSLQRPDWNALAIALVHEMQQETLKQLFALWGWEPKKSRNTSYRDAAEEQIPKLSGTDIAKFFLDCTLVGDVRVFTWSQDKPERLLSAAKRYGVNIEAVKRQLNAAEIPKAKKAKGKHK